MAKEGSRVTGRGWVPSIPSGAHTQCPSFPPLGPASRFHHLPVAPGLGTKPSAQGPLGDIQAQITTLSVKMVFGTTVWLLLDFFPARALNRESRKCVFLYRGRVQIFPIDM